MSLTTGLNGENFSFLLPTSLAKKLGKLGLQKPTDLQEKLLEAVDAKSMDFKREARLSKKSNADPHAVPLKAPPGNILLVGPEGSGRGVTLALLNELSVSHAMAYQKESQEIVKPIIVLVSAHSRQQSLQLHETLSALSSLQCSNLYMSSPPSELASWVLIGNPLQLYNLAPALKGCVQGVVVHQLDFHFGFGYAETLEKLLAALPQDCSKKVSSMAITEEIDTFKTKWMPKCFKVVYESPKEIERAQQEPMQVEGEEGDEHTETKGVKHEPAEGSLTLYYSLGDDIYPIMSLYLALKFSLSTPKTLILCQDLESAYRVYLFLERTNIPAVSLYNHLNPAGLKWYVLSSWMGGKAEILVTTSHFLQELTQGGVLEQECKNKAAGNRQLHRNLQRVMSLPHLSTVICLGLTQIESHMSCLLQKFNRRPFLMAFCKQSEQQIASLQGLLSQAKDYFAVVNGKELPIPRKQIEGFRYRVNDVWSSLTKRKVKLIEELDLKKKMLRSPDMREHYQSHPKDKQTLVQAINKTRRQLDTNKISLPEAIPMYLVPQCLKTSYGDKLKAIVRETQQSTPKHYQQVRQVLKHIEQNEEEPEKTEVDRLRLISARKRWKLLRGFKLKKRNFRNEKKGIFQ